MRGMREEWVGVVCAFAMGLTLWAGRRRGCGWAQDMCGYEMFDKSV